MSSIVIHSKNPYIETALTGMDVSNTKVTKYYTKDTTQETQTSTSCSLCPNLPVRTLSLFQAHQFRFTGKRLYIKFTRVPNA